MLHSQEPRVNMNLQKKSFSSKKVITKALMIMANASEYQTKTS